MFGYIKSILYPKLLLSNFIEIRKILDDTFNNVKNGKVRLEYYTSNNIEIGYIQYKTNGQIGLFFIKKEYQNRGLGKQILTKVIKELKANYSCTEIWAVSSKNHPFWSNVYNKQFKYCEPAHRSITGGGYHMPVAETFDAY